MKIDYCPGIQPHLEFNILLDYIPAFFFILAFSFHLLLWASHSWLTVVTHFLWCLLGGHDTLVVIAPSWLLWTKIVLFAVVLGNTITRITRITVAMKRAGNCTQGWYLQGTLTFYWREDLPWGLNPGFPKYCHIEILSLENLSQVIYNKRQKSI